MHPIIAAIQQNNLKKVPEVKTGYTVRVSQKIKEGSKERIQHFEGLVIKVSSGHGVEKTFTVRKMVEGIGVEKVFPFHSSTITTIHVIKKAAVRRQKLYYMRNRFGKSARLSEKHVTDEERAAEEAKMEALYAEAVKAEEKRVKEEMKEADEEEVTNATNEEMSGSADAVDIPSESDPEAVVAEVAQVTEEEVTSKE